MKPTLKDYLKLFSVTFYLSAFTFGGGYVIIALMRKKMVEELHWLGEDEMLNMTAIAQSTPGAVAVNASILVGYRIAGFPGALIATFGTVLPPLIILSVISFFYVAFKQNVAVAMVLKGMSAAIAAVIADVVVNMGGNVLRSGVYYAVAIMFLAFVAKIFVSQVAWILLVCGLIGLAFGWYERRSKGVNADGAL